MRSMVSLMVECMRFNRELGEQIHALAVGDYVKILIHDREYYIHKRHALTAADDIAYSLDIQHVHNRLEKLT